VFPGISHAPVPRGGALASLKTLGPIRMPNRFNLHSDEIWCDNTGGEERVSRASVTSPFQEVVH